MLNYKDTQDLKLQMQEEEKVVKKLREQIARNVENQEEYDRLKNDCKNKDTTIHELKDKVTELEQSSPIIPETLQVLEANSIARGALLDEVFLPYLPDPLAEQNTTTTTRDDQTTVAEDRPIRRRADRGGFRKDEVQVQATAALIGLHNDQDHPANAAGRCFGKTLVDLPESSFVPESQICLPFGTQIPLANPLQTLGSASFEDSTPVTETQRSSAGPQSIARAPSTSSQVDAMLLDSLDSSADCRPTRSLRKRKSELLRESSERTHRDVLYFLNRTVRLFHTLARL